MSKKQKPLKCPLSVDHVSILGTAYAIVRMSGFVTKDKKHGELDPDGRNPTITTDEDLTPQQQAKVLQHEIVHGYTIDMGCAVLDDNEEDEKAEETMVIQITTCWFDFCRYNPDLAVDIINMAANRKFKEE